MLYFVECDMSTLITKDYFFVISCKIFIIGLSCINYNQNVKKTPSELRF